MNLFADTITRWRPTETIDRYGQVVMSWDPGIREDIRRVNVQPGETVETMGDRNQVISGLRVFTPKGRDIDLVPSDRVVVEGVVWEVDGEVSRFRIGGRIHHAEVRLKRFAG